MRHRLLPRVYHLYVVGGGDHPQRRSGGPLDRPEVGPQKEVKHRVAFGKSVDPLIFGLPRIITSQESLERLIGLVDSPCNGRTFCTGSLGADPENDLPAMIRAFGGKGRIHFAHVRNVRITGHRSFVETAHRTSDGSVDMYKVMKAFWDVRFDGPMRPDHGRMIWGETGRPGYGLYDRALGAVYLNGIREALQRSFGGLP